MKNITRIVCGIVISIIGMTCVACTNSDNQNNTTTEATTETITETETIVETETTTEIVETEDTTEEAETTETITETVETQTETVINTEKNLPENKNVSEKNQISETKENVIYNKGTDIEDRAMGSENVEEKNEEPVNSENSLSISEADYILLCNAVAHEAGSDWISTEEKAKVAEVILNRVNSDAYSDTIYGVLTEKGQFSGASSYVNLGDYSGKVSQDVKDAVDMALDDSYNNNGYMSFWGDGRQNHFS